jgi:SpoVK/Ycf46/Vps4 family AAA+-type ATPase
VGPLGTGKTTLVRAIAKNQNIRLIELNLPFILSLPPPKQVESVNSIFQKLINRQEKRPTVLLLDNLEILQRAQHHPEYIPLLQSLLIEIGKVKLTRDKLLVIGIINENQATQLELLNLFNEKIDFKLPDQISRALILRKILTKTNLEMDIDLDDISSKLAEPTLTEGFSAYDLKELTNIAKIQVFTEGRTLLNEKDLVAAVEILKARTLQPKPSQTMLHPSQLDSTSNQKVHDLEEELKNIKMLLTNSTRMVKHSLRLALSDNYNFITRLFNHYQMTKKPMKSSEIAQVTGIKDENALKLLKKMPYRLLFPKIGDMFYVIFDKPTIDEILSELALSL